MEHEGKMKGHMMMCPMCMGIATGMTRVRIAATSDGGAIVSTNGRLMKYDGQLNLVKRIDLPLDIEQIHRQMLEMMAHHGEEGEEEPPEPPGHHHHGRRP